METFRLLFHNHPIPMWIYDLETLAFLEVNDAAIETYGYSREEFLAMTIRDIRPPEDVPLLIEDVNKPRADRSGPAEWRHRLRDGRVIDVEITSHLLDFHGRLGALVMAADITERRALQQQLFQAQKLESLGTLAGGIAHDFNNLLAMILGSAELLREHANDHPELKKYVDRIIDASERGTSISRQLLIFSRPGEAELQPMTFSQTISEVHTMLRHFLPRSISIETLMESDTGIVLGDAGQIHQALLNLALNAADAMENEGRLVIKEFIPPVGSLKERFPHAREDRYIAVSVIDTGKGMDEATIGKIFDPFFSTKERSKGTGLGLAIVHGIMNNHRGFIGVESVPGLGSSFTLFFPLVADNALPHAAETAVHGPAHEATLLLVDDEESIRETLAEYLATYGYRVYTASNGTEALAVYKLHHASIDLVFTDLGMPEMGGEELFCQLRSVDPDAKVIVSSGYLDGITKDQLLTIGIKEVLTKPCKMEAIRQAIERILSPA